MGLRMRRCVERALLCAVLAGGMALGVAAAKPTWEAESAQTRPWVYNWWMGNAVTEAGLEAQARALAEGGFGGFHVIPIYGVKGNAANEPRYLSPAWREKWAAAKRAAARHGLGIDLTTGCGWCFGGRGVPLTNGAWRVDAQGRPEPGRIFVKRAPAQDRGFMLDPYSPQAMRDYLKAFEVLDEKPRAFYHDSWEYFGAAWTPRLFEAFKARRGYDLAPRWRELAGTGQAPELRKLRLDYRETLAELAVETFGVWADWCRARGILTRNEAHGAPANWLDLYALADIPETEMFDDCRDVLVSKFASSAAHVKGTRLVSAESCTWIGEHFRERPGEIKRFLDLLFLAGVNHVFYQGCCYSPPEASWPGWCFYAALEMNPRSPLWRIMPSLNGYVSRVQALAQASEPGEDTLVYWPVRDFWAERPGLAEMMSVHNAARWFGAQPIGATARRLAAAGVCFDYVSDKMIAALPEKPGRYRSLVVPPCREMPEATRRRLADLARNGWEVVWEGGLPQAARRETALAASGVGFVRFRRKGETLWFAVNTNEAPRTVTLPRPQLWRLDPLTGEIAAVAGSIQLEPGHACFLQTGAEAADVMPPARPPVRRTSLDGPWELVPVCGGPGTPAPRTLAKTGPWSRNADGSENPFCGTMRYRCTFDAADGAAGGTLDLGDVREAARVCLNGRDLGTRFMKPYVFAVPPGALRAKGNVLDVEVTNTGSNRLRDLDRRGVAWKIFTDINMVSKDYKPLDASKYPFEAAGLLGPVTLETGAEEKDAEDKMAGFAAALVDAGGAVQAGDVLPMRLDPSFVVPQTALPESWRGRTEMTNFYPVAGAGALDVIRSEAAAFGGVAEVTAGELTFALTAEDGRELWSSGPLKAGARARFAVDVKDQPLVTFRTRGTGTGAWRDLDFVRNRAEWPHSGREIDAMHPLATYRREQIVGNRDWENPLVFERNRLPRHAFAVAYETEAAARANWGRAASGRWLSLDGAWKALFTPHPDAAPAGFEQRAFDDAAWRSVLVPNTSEIVGMGTPLFCAFGYWWTVDPPFVTRPAPPDWTVAKEPNGTVNYRRAFTVPEGWRNLRTILVFDGFGAAVRVWLNGREVGYAEDGRPGAEFDVTPHLQAGTNLLAVQVYRLCDGCYMEDQDYFRLSGLFRSVWLRAEHATHVADFTVVTRRATEAEPYAGGAWCADVRAVVAGARGGETLTARLYDAQGKQVAEARTPCGPAAGATAALPLAVRAPALWNAETPNLYRLVLTLADREGRTLEAFGDRVGFREIAWGGATIRVNGAAVKFNGVNRHEIAPETGYTMTEALLRRDLDLLKRSNVNAIRLAHYPNDPRFYELADEYGFYVVDEANFESHGLSQHGWNGFRRRKFHHGLGGARNPAVDPRFRAAALDRETGMVLRDRNRPCVVMWSLGNEIFVTSDFFTEAYDALKALDPTRPVMNQRNGKKDVVDDMYAPPRRLLAYARGAGVDKPFIPCEYEHTEGNSYGNLMDYARAFWSSEVLQGGFLWDWADQDFPQKRDAKDVKPGQPAFRWAYGGDFGDRPGHGTGCCNGAVRADRTPSPGVPELSYIYQDAHVVASDPAHGVFTVTNRAYFTSLAKYGMRWTCEDDGRAVASGDLGRLDVPPQGGRTLRLPVPPPTPGARRRTWTFVWTAAADTAWCKAGFACARDQVVEPEQPGGLRVCATASTLRVEETPNTVRLRLAADAQTWTVSKTAGVVTGWTVGGEEMLRSPIEPYFWRAPVSKERDALEQVRGVWQEAGARREVRACAVRHDATAATVRVDFAFPTAGATTGRAVYRFDGMGLRVAFTLEPKGLKPIRVSKGWMRPPVPVPPPIPRIGMVFRTSPAFGHARWFGRGPHENYPGRTASAFFGRYARAAADFLFPYAKPQESGNRGDVYELAVTDGAGKGFAVTAPGRPLHVNLLAYTAEELERRRHQAELEPCGDLIVHLDGFQRGVDGSGAGLHADQELVAEGTYSFSFVLSPAAAAVRSGGRVARAAKRPQDPVRGACAQRKPLVAMECAMR